MAVGTRAKPLLDEELEELFGLIKGADSVELKVTVADAHQHTTATALGFDPLDAEIRQVYFFDTPDLTLNDHGLVVRARRVQQKTGDSVIKLRPVVPTELPKKLRRLPEFVVEVDAMPGGYVCSASLKAPLDNAAVLQVASGERPTRRLFSKAQREFFAAHAPDGIELDDLTLLGPITVFKLRFRPSDYDRKLVAELWAYPDNSRILELSTKSPPADALRVALETRAFLRGRGVDLTGKQQTKTKTALNYFAKRA